MLSRGSSGRHRARVTVRHALKKIGAVLAAAAVIAGVTVTTATAASTLGAGFNRGDWIGNAVAPDGSFVFCVDVAQDSLPSGGQGQLVSTISSVSGTRALSGDDIRRLNYAVSVHGQTWDPVRAAAVSAYVWSISSANHAGDGVHYIHGKAPASVWGAVETAYWQVRADTEAHFQDGQTGQGSGALAFHVDTTDTYRGTLTLSAFSAPAGTSGTIRLTNGVFTGTGTATLAGVTGNGSWAVRGVAPDDGGAYKISAAATFGVTTPGPYTSTVRLYSDEIQRSIGPGTRLPGFTQFTLNAADPQTRSPRFAPTLTTAVGARYLRVGDPMTDTITFSVVPGTTGWFRNSAGKYTPVRARGVLYGPLPVKPKPGDSVAGLPVAGRATVTATTSDGPNQRYTVTADTNAPASGYYSWEWTISADDQLAGMAVFLRQGYQFTDPFGKPAETHVVLPEFATQADTQSTPGATASDVLMVVGVIPADTRARFTAYHQAVGTDGVFESPSCTSSNQVWQSGWVPVTAAETRSPAMSLDMSHQGRILWVAEATVEGGAQAAYTGACGDPQEVTLVTVPEVVTDAVDQSVPGSTARDSVTVTGFLPPEGVDVTFAAFRQDDPDVPVCAPENQVWASSAATHLSEEGTGWSEDFRVTMEHMLPGSKETWVFWQETAKIGDVVVHVGECGAPDERTLLTIPEISTDAEPFATPFSTVRDNLSVAGFFPPEGLTVKYRAYLQPAPANDADPAVASAPVCEPENLVIEGDEHHLTGEGEFVSEDFEVAREHVGTLFWSEIVSVAGTVIHEGVCGAPTEITKVEFPSFVTEAAQGFVGEDAYDVATVTGLVPDGAYLTFEAFWAGQGDELVQSDANLFNPSWKDKKFPVVGKSTAPVGQLANDQQLVVQSDGELVTRLGRVQWVAHLWAPDGTLISSGAFDDPAEMTVLKRSRVKGIIDGLEYSGSSVKTVYLGAFVGLLLAAAFLAAAFIAWRRRRV